MDISAAFTKSSVRLSSEMDPALWSSLPSPLLELVITKLPFLSLTRLRVVCKAWNSLILSKGFSPPNPHPKTVLLATYTNCRKPSFVSYNVANSCWHVQSIVCPSHIVNLDFEDIKLAATGGGLLCFEVSPNSDCNFIVCNPVTKAWKRLPCLNTHPRILPGTPILWRAAGLVYDVNTSSYKLVVAGFSPVERDNGRNWFLKATQVYNSLSDSWTLSIQDREVMGGKGSFRKSFNKSVFSKDHLYVVTCMDFSCGHDVAIFSMNKGTWLEISAFEFTVDDCPAYLVDCEDQIFLVAEELQETYTQTFVFWKLNIPDIEFMWSQEHPDTRDLWLKHKSVPRDELPLISGISIRSLNWACVGHRNSNIVSFLFCTQKFWRPFDTVLVHDMSDNSWRTIDGPEPAGLEDSCSFEPSLSAFV